MLKEDYEMVMGLEVHAELSTKTKIFCSCPTEFGAEPNTHVCPVCMAMPGALPVLNEKVVEYAVKAGLATNCEISKDSKNDRIFGETFYKRLQRRGEDIREDGLRRSGKHCGYLLQCLFICSEICGRACASKRVCHCRRI